MTDAVPEPGLYIGRVMHARVRPVRHAFVYRVFSLLLDIDRVTELSVAVRGFGHNRPALLAFYDCDHGPRDGAPLRPWVEALLERSGTELRGGPIRLLCFPRILGYVFNPLSIYFCYGRRGALAAIVYQVHNTFGETHAYVCPVRPGKGPVDQTAEKAFYVSPFIDLKGRYAFRLRPPGDRLAISIRESGADGLTLIATHNAVRRPFTSANVLKLWASHPLMTLKVIAGIHWEALRLWMKGVRFAPPATKPAAQGR